MHRHKEVERQPRLLGLRGWNPQGSAGRHLPFLSGTAAPAPKPGRLLPPWPYRTAAVLPAGTTAGRCGLKR